MKKKIFISLILLIVVFAISIFIPVRKGMEWTHSSSIYDVGYEKTCYYNIYGANITMFFENLLKTK